MSRPDAMRAQVPDPVYLACVTLRDAGYEAWIVGGAVRDLVLGKTPSDWDVATDALPEKVLELFERTIATGLQHGTVTAMVGRGKARTPVEITTFRGEGAYSDARRPDSVHFGVPLDEDLKRRDFVINAMAFDPTVQQLHDPFDGAGDLKRRQIRAVGVAEQRFAEDGLRVMRAIRFISTLDFELETKTEEALSTALDALSKVACERVRVELLKLLGGVAPTRALKVAERNQVLKTVLPELSSESVLAALPRIDCAPGDSVLRLAALLWDLPTDSLDDLLRRLTMSNEERRRIVAMLRLVGEFDAISTDLQLRHFLSRVGRAAAKDTLALLASNRSDTARAEEVLASGVALEIGELAIGGGQLMQVAGIRGPAVGETLRYLLTQVLIDPSCNTSKQLEELALAQR